MEAEEFVNRDSGNVRRQEIQAAIAKSMELRTLYSALMQANNPTHLGLQSTCYSSANDYPVFNPSYKDEPLPGYIHMKKPSHMKIESWDENSKSENQNDQTTVNASANTKLSSANKSKSVNSSCTNHIVPLRSSRANINIPHNKSWSILLSWLLPRFKRRSKNITNSPVRSDSESESESEEVTQVLKDYGILSVETLKKELIEANQKRDEAIMEVIHVKSSFGELKKKLEDLESYCQDLKEALNQVKQVQDSNNNDSSVFAQEEILVEGFIQIVSESRLSVRNFCEIFAGQIGETDEQLVQNLNRLLKPYRLSFNSRHSKVVFHHFEAIINQVFFQDFENCVFQKNGAPKLLHPQLDRDQQLKSFDVLRDLTWEEIVKKGTRYYSEEFSRFCDQKMSGISSTLKWIKPWPEPLLKSFFVAAKSIWLLHLLAFSFYPPLTILRVEENREFDLNYMENVLTDDERVHGLSRVKIMVMPGFYVQDKILSCKVLCW